MSGDALDHLVWVLSFHLILSILFNLCLIAPSTWPFILLLTIFKVIWMAQNQDF